MAEKDTARSQFLMMCHEVMDGEKVTLALEMFDRALYPYDVVAKSEALTTLGATTEDLLKLYAATMAIRNLSMGTIENRIICLKNFFGMTGSSPKTATKDDVRMFIYQKLKEGKKPNTINGYRGTINSFYDFLVGEGEVDKNIVTSVPKLKEEKRLLKPMAQMDIVAMRDAADRQISKIARLRDRAIIEVLYTSGVRVSELVNMKINDIKRNEHCEGSTPVFVSNGKGKKQRMTYINDEALWHLDAYLKERKGNSEYVFVSTQAPHNSLTTETIEDRVRKLRAAANVEYATPHTYRRTCATHMIGVNVPIQDVQKILGHASIETTTRYAQTTDDHVRGEHRRAFG